MTRLNSLPEKYRKQVEQKVSTGDNCKLVIPGELPTMNEIINKSKTHWAKYKKIKETYDSLIAYCAEQQRIKFFEAAEFHITYYCKDRRKDPDNISSGGRKVLLDGLVQAGVLENDGWKQVKGFTEKWEVDKDNPRVEVEIKEV